MSIDIRITGTANMGQVSKELSRVQAQAVAMSKSVTAASKSGYAAQTRMGAGGSSTSGMQNQIRGYRQMGVAMNAARDNLLDLTRANGEFETTSMKVGKHVDYLTDRIQKQQMGFREARREAKALGDVYKHQLALEKASVVTWGQTAAGSTKADLFTPNLGKQQKGIESARKKMGFYGEVLGSVSKKTIDWGKNTQWAGRQLMSGFTYPLTVAAGIAVKYAYDIDKALTQITKVYGSVGEANAKSNDDIKKSAMDTAKYLTQFGQSATDTLEIQSQLASSGKTGDELQKTTQVVSKARLLGELDIQDAMKATITMQSVYGYSTDQLAEKFNFMNQMENETSLTMQDFVEGVPKISGIMNTLGADFEDTGILLAAMKTAGIDAKEGGNAVKSMVFKDIAPSAKALKTFSNATGESLKTIVDSTKGDPIKTLQGIGKAMEGLPGEEKVAIIKEVFGIHQGSKALGMIESLTEKTGQMGKAFEIANADTSEWAATAQRELRTLREADWVKAKKAVEDLKLAVADIGKVILTTMTPALQSIANALKGAGEWFSGLDKGKQQFIVWAAAAVAAAGPAIMMVGLFANLAGQAMTFGANLFKLMSPLKLYTSRQKIAELANQRAAKSADSLAGANLRLANSYQVITKKARFSQNPAAMAGTYAAAGYQGGVKPAATQSAAKVNPIPVRADRNIMPMSASGRDVFAKNGAVNNSAKILENTKKTERSWYGISEKTGSVALAAGMAGTMATESDSALNNISNMVLTAALIGPMFKPLGGIIAGAFGSKTTRGPIAKLAYNFKTGLVGAFTGAMTLFDQRVVRSAKKAKHSMGTALATGGVAGGTVGGVAPGGAAKGSVAKAGGAKAVASGLMGGIAAAAPQIAIVTAAVGAYFYAFHKGAKEAKARQDALNGSVKTLGDHLGLATSELDKFKIGSKKNTDNQYVELAEEYKKNNKAFADGVARMSSTEKSAKRAIQQGIVKAQEGMVKYGWNKEEAMEYARTYAVAINKEVAYGIDKKITIDPFVSVGTVKLNQMDRINRAMEQAMSSKSNAINNNPEKAWFKKNSKGYSNDADPNSTNGPLIEASKLTGEGQAEIKRNIKAGWDVFSRTQGAERDKAFDTLGKNIYSSLDGVYGDMSKKQKEILRREGVVDSKTLAEYADKNGPQAVVDLLEKGGAKMSSKAQKKMGESIQLINEAIIQLLMKARGKTRKEIEAIYGDEPLLDMDLVAQVDGMAVGAGMTKGWEERKVIFKDFRTEMSLAKQARKALTDEEKIAAGKAYSKEYGNIQGLIRYTNELALAQGERKKLTKAEMEAIIVDSFKGKKKSIGGFVDGVQKMSKQIDKATKTTKGLSSAEELSRLNTKRRAAGLKETENAQDGMNSKVTKSEAQLKKEAAATDKNTEAKKKNAKANASWRGVKDIMAGGADQPFTLSNPTDEEAQAAAGKYKEVWENVTDEMFEEVSSGLDNQHESIMNGIEKAGEARAKRIEAREEAGNARFDRRQEALDKKWETKEAKFEAGWDRTMENFDARWDAKNDKFELRWDNTMEKFDAKWDSKTEKFDAKWDKTMARFDTKWDGRMERFDAKWDNANEKFDNKWDKTMENFDTKWETKSEKFEKKWDNTMERFEKSSEKAKEAVEKQYDARIKRIEDAIEAEQKAEAVRQRIFEKEKARIAHLADMANRRIDIDVAINTGDLDEAARLSNDAQASIDTYEIDDAGEESQSASDAKISGLEKRKEKVEKKKDAAIRRIEERIEAERKALEESRRIAQKAFEVAQNKERKILEAQRDRQRKAMESQRAAQQKALEAQREHQRQSLESKRNNERKILDAQRTRQQKALESQRADEQKKMETQREGQRKSLESQRNSQKTKLQSQKAATYTRLERERFIFGKEIQSAKDSNDRITKSKTEHEQTRYEKAKAALEKEMRALKAFTPRNRRELKEHIGKLKKSYEHFGYTMETKGGEWSKQINDSLQYWIRVAQNEMAGDKAWDTLGKSIANRMTKGAFNKDIKSFMKWVEGGGKGWSSSAPKSTWKSKKKKGPGNQKKSLMDKALTGGRHKGGMVDDSKGSRTGYSGTRQSQSEVTINALKGEAVLNRKAVRTIGKDGIDAINRGELPNNSAAKRPSVKKQVSKVQDDRVNQRGDGPPIGLAAIPGMMIAKMTTMAMGRAIQDKGEEQQAEDAMAFSDFGPFSGSNFEAFWKALGIQESGGNYNAVNSSTGALGKYQVLPSNVNRWSKMFLGRPMTPNQFLKTPKFQEELVKAALGSMYKKNGPRGAASEWYSGNPKLHMSTRKQPGGPSIKGYVDGVIAKMNKLIGSRGGSGGGAMPPGGGGGRNVWPGMGYRKMWEIIHARFPNRAYPEPNQINRGGHVKNSYHYRNRALDLGSAKANGTPMSTLFNWLYKTYGRQSTQIIYGPARSRNIKDGRHHDYGSSTAAAHMGHVHWAMKNGGVVPGRGAGDRTPIMGQPGEFMVRKKAVDKVGPDFLKALNSDRFVNMPNVAVSSAGAAGKSSGGANVDNSYSPVYNVNINANGNQDPKDIGDAVETALTRIERRKGFDRRIGSK